MKLDWKQFIVIGFAVLVLVGGVGFWNDVYNSVKVTPTWTGGWTAPLAKDEAVNKWLRDREQGVFNATVVERDENDRNVRVRYQTRDSSGTLLVNERIFRFDESGRLATVDRVSTEAVQAAPGNRVAVSDETFPWGERAKKTGGSSSHPWNLSARNAQAVAPSSAWQGAPGYRPETKVSAGGVSGGEKFSGGRAGM